jgi:deoxyadenosine/deoxycytidine kinase
MTPINTRRPRICAIEGNIGAGKTTIYEHLKRHFASSSSRVVFMPEPVDIWETIRDASGKTILEKFYANPKYAFPFQIMAYSTRLAMLRKIIHKNPDCELILCERSLEADHNIFAKMLFDSGKIEDVEYQIYELLFHDTAAEFALDGAVYIDSSPEVCHQRIAKRARAGESVIPLDYLTNCCNYYNRWLVPEQFTNVVAPTLCQGIAQTHASESISAVKFPILHLDTNVNATYLETDPEDCGNEWIRKVVEFVTNMLE